MLPKFAVRLVASTNARKIVARNIGSTAVVLNKTDPIQQVFLDTVRQYFKKKSTSKGGLIDSSPENLKSLNDELDKVNRQYGVTGKSFDEFPAFKFEEPKLDSISIQEKK